MKRITLLSAIALILLLTQKTQAQKKINVGFNGGLTLSQLRTKVGSISDNSGWHPGFSLGLIAQMLSKGSFGFQPGFNFTQKGGQQSQTYNGTTAKYSATLNYLEIPLNFIYYSKGKKGHFVAGAGPSMAYCLWGKSRGSSGGSSSTYSLKIGNGENDDMKPFEFGGNLVAGYQDNNGFTLMLNYNMGFSNLATDDQSSLKNNYFGVRIGYLLRSK